MIAGLLLFMAVIIPVIHDETKPGSRTRKILFATIIALAAINTYQQVLDSNRDEQVSRTVTQVSELSTTILEKANSSNVKVDSILKELTAWKSLGLSPTRGPEKPLKITSGSLEEEESRLPEKVKALRKLIGDEAALPKRIQLAEAYLKANAFTLARREFERIAFGNYDDISKDVGELLGRAVRVGLGDKIASHEIGLGYIVQWDQEVPKGASLRAYGEVSRDGKTWKTFTTPLPNSAGSVIQEPIGQVQFVRVKFDLEISPHAESPKIHGRSLVLRVGLIGKNWSIYNPAFMGRPMLIGP